MNIKHYNDFLEYLSGKKFSTGQKFKYLLSKNEITLKDYVSHLVKNKNVIHIGACDHLEVIDKKIQEDNFLHTIISKFSKECIGIDVNSTAVEYLKQKYNIDNIVILDIVNSEIPEKIKNMKWDYILLLDVLEHIENPGIFLKELHKKFYGIAKNVILSVPNAFCLNNVFNIFKCEELINTDHKFWFTPYTLCKLLTIAGFIPLEISFVQRAQSYPKKIL